MKYDTTEEATTAIQAIIRMATPKATTRGKQSRNKMVNSMITACKQMTYDKRVKK